MITIVLADDHHVVRQGLRALLQAESDLSILGEAADGLEAVQLTEQLKPDVLILDMVMPHLNGIEVARQVSQRFPKTHVVILSMHSDEAYVLQALTNGASGYVLKESSSVDLITAVHEANVGHRYLSPPLSERAIEIYLRKARELTMDLYETLTTREREILQLAAEGQSNQEVAQKFSISPRTVEVHRANLMRKLNLRTQTELIRFALKRGIISQE